MARSAVAAALLFPTIFAALYIKSATPSRRVRAASVRSAVGRSVQFAGLSGEAVEPGLPQASDKADRRSIEKLDATRKTRPVDAGTPRSGHNLSLSSDGEELLLDPLVRIFSREPNLLDPPRGPPLS